jgi:hypothetical protein
MAGMHRALALRIKADFQRNGRIVRRLPEAFQLALIHQWIRLHQRIGARPTWQRITILTLLIIMLRSLNSVGEDASPVAW